MSIGTQTIPEKQSAPPPAVVWQADEPEAVGESFDNGSDCEGLDIGEDDLAINQLYSMDMAP